MRRTTAHLQLDAVFHKQFVGQQQSPCHPVTDISALLVHGIQRCLTVFMRCFYFTKTPRVFPFADSRYSRAGTGEFLNQHQDDVVVLHLGVGRVRQIRVFSGGHHETMHVQNCNLFLSYTNQDSCSWKGERPTGFLLPRMRPAKKVGVREGGALERRNIGLPYAVKGILSTHAAATQYSFMVTQLLWHPGIVEIIPKNQDGISMYRVVIG